MTGSQRIERASDCSSSVMHCVHITQDDAWSCISGRAEDEAGMGNRWLDSTAAGRRAPRCRACGGWISARHQGSEGRQPETLNSPIIINESRHHRWRFLVKSSPEP
jgi:hypothetical protein